MALLDRSLFFDQVTKAIFFFFFLSDLQAVSGQAISQLKVRLLKSESILLFLWKFLKFITVHHKQGGEKYR